MVYFEIHLTPHECNYTNNKIDYTFNEFNLLSRTSLISMINA